MIVIPDAPVKQVNNAQITKDAIPTPPAKNPNKESIRLNNLCGALLSAKIYPASVKSGIARSVGADAILYNSTIITVGSIPEFANSVIAKPPIATNSGIPAKINNINNMLMKTNIIVNYLPAFQKV